ncbi:MAG: DUF2147 domain-containing protein [Cytophagales bacterium]|nr:MAG: DUF2147 domain-containing protein [Cytophagales bacterium]
MLFINFLILPNQAQAQIPIPSEWKTIDDNTGKERSIIRIFKSTDGKYYGKIVKLINPSEPDPSCTKCPNDAYRKNGEKIVGLLVITNMDLVNGELVNGNILDPENGKDYSCKIWLDPAAPNKLYVRGYWGVFYRTQTWYRAN